MSVWLDVLRIQAVAETLDKLGLSDISKCKFSSVESLPHSCEVHSVTEIVRDYPIIWEVLVYNLMASTKMGTRVRCVC